MVNDKSVPVTLGWVQARRGGREEEEVASTISTVSRSACDDACRADLCLRKCIVRVYKTIEKRGIRTLGFGVTLLFAGTVRRAGGPLHFVVVSRAGSTGRLIYASLLSSMPVAAANCTARERNRCRHPPSWSGKTADNENFYAFIGNKCEILIR